MVQNNKQFVTWSRWAALTMAIIFTGVFLWLNSRQYLSFQTQAPDIDRFYQAIWNTLRGRFLYSTITNSSILSFHFSPYMALLSPLLLIWTDIRILFLAQIVSIAITGLILYKIVEEKYPILASLFLLAFYLNATLHQVTLFELRRVTFAMPFLALMLYGLVKEKRWLILVGIFIALLSKESLGLVVAAVGLYLLIFRRDWKWGIPITVLGFAWSLSMLLWVIPAIRGDSYKDISYFSIWGGTPTAIAKNIVSNPGQALAFMFDRDGVAALWRTFLPLAIILPFLAADLLVIAIPLLVMMLLSSDANMHTLRSWNMAAIVPILFAAVAVGITRLPRRFAPWAVAGLLLASIIAYRAYSPAPLGKHFRPNFYQVTDRHQTAWDVIETVPDDAIVAAQVAFTPGLSNREHIYLYPWYAIGEENVEYFVMAEELRSYPISAEELNYEINNLIADPNIIVEEEVNGIYLLRQGGPHLPSFDINQVAEEAIKLDRFEIAVADEQGWYQTESQKPLAVSPGQRLRVTLYWEALDAPNAERTVSVRVEDSTGALVAQHDMMPADGSRPTSWWEPGWRFRDVYYLTLSNTAVPGPASLDLVLYDTFTQERISFSDDETVLRLLPLTIEDDT